MPVFISPYGNPEVWDEKPSGYVTAEEWREEHPYTLREVMDFYGRALQTWLNRFVQQRGYDSVDATAKYLDAYPPADATPEDAALIDRFRLEAEYVHSRVPLVWARFYGIFRAAAANQTPVPKIDDLLIGFGDLLAWPEALEEAPGPARIDESLLPDQDIQVGLFWADPQTQGLFGVRAESLAASHMRDSDRLLYPFHHIMVWPGVVEESPQYSHLPGEIKPFKRYPRGRVFFLLTPRQVVIQHGSWLADNEWARDAILDTFNLRGYPNIRWERTHRYEVEYVSPVPPAA